MAFGAHHLDPDAARLAGPGGGSGDVDDLLFDAGFSEGYECEGEIGERIAEAETQSLEQA